MILSQMVKIMFLPDGSRPVKTQPCGKLIHMITLYRSFLLLAVLIIAGASCRKDKVPVKPSTQPKVYVVGAENNSSNVPAAKLWVDGKEKIIATFPTEKSYAISTSVFVTGTKLVIGGNEIVEGQSRTAKIWSMDNTDAAIKAFANSNQSTFTDGKNDAFITGVYQTTNRGVVASGTITNGSNYIAAYWQNGVLKPLTDGTREAKGLGIYADASNSYIAGYESNGNTYVAKVWKSDFTSTSLTNGKNTARAEAVFLSGGDVYVAGYEHDGVSKIVAKYWKNGTPMALTDASGSATYATSIFVVGADVYVAGYKSMGSLNRACFWKNGVVSYLTDGTKDAVALSIFVYGTDVYVAGHEIQGNIYVAKFWKNGVATNLTNGAKDARATGIYVY